MALHINPQVEVGVFHLREGYLTQVCAQYSFFHRISVQVPQCSTVVQFFICAFNNITTQ